jgi:hypothetical protein
MTDRELLELAAKATGLWGRWPGADVPPALRAVAWTLRGKPWYPLADDGDALWLAVKLGLSIEVYLKHPDGRNASVDVRGYEFRRSLAVEHAADNGASLQCAMRRAIVRAAAEIGRAMP